MKRGQRSFYFSAAGENKWTGRDNILCMAVKWWEGWRSGRAWLSHSASTAVCVVGASDVNCGSLAGHLVTSLMRQSWSDGAEPRSPERTSVPICSARPPLPPPPSPAASSSAGADCSDPLSSREPRCLSPKNYSKDWAVVLFKLAVTLTWPLHSLPLRFQTPSSPSQNPVMCFSPLFLSILTLMCLWIPAWKHDLAGQEAFLVWTVFLLRVISALSRFVSWFHWVVLQCTTANEFLITNAWRSANKMS